MKIYESFTFSKFVICSIDFITKFVCVGGLVGLAIVLTLRALK